MPEVIETGNCMFCGRLIAPGNWICHWCDWTDPSSGNAQPIPVIDLSTGAFTALEMVDL